MTDLQDKLSRRRFMRLAALSAGGIYLFSRCAGPTAVWRFFTTSEARLMDALADQIIPPDEWPGGRESGVTNFIDKQLNGPYLRFQSEYRKGLKGIQDSSETLYHQRFENLNWKEQTSFLELMEAGKMNEPVWADGFDLKFFGLIRDHSMQSYYGSSRHGGNRDNISYKMLKLDYPFIVGQNRYKS